MSKNKLKGRTICPRCHKAFDNRTEGFILYGLVYCANCYHKMDEMFKSKNMNHPNN